MALLSYIITALFNYYYIVFVFVCLVSLHNVVSVQYNGAGLLPKMILLTQCYYHRGINPFECHEEVLSLQPIYDPTTF